MTHGDLEKFLTETQAALDARSGDKFHVAPDYIEEALAIIRQQAAELDRVNAEAAAMREFVTDYLQECWEEFEACVERCDDNGVPPPDYIALSAKDLRAQEAAASTGGASLLAEIERYRAWAAVAVELLKEHGFYLVDEDDGTWRFCEECNTAEHLGHADDCRLAAALASAPNAE